MRLTTTTLLKTFIISSIFIISFYRSQKYGSFYSENQCTNHEAGCPLCSPSKYVDVNKAQVEVIEEKARERLKKAQAVVSATLEIAIEKQRKAIIGVISKNNKKSAASELMFRNLEVMELDDYVAGLNEDERSDLNHLVNGLKLLYNKAGRALVIKYATPRKIPTGDSRHLPELGEFSMHSIEIADKEFDQAMTCINESYKLDFEETLSGMTQDKLRDYLPGNADKRDSATRLREEAEQEHYRKLGCNPWSSLIYALGNSLITLFALTIASLLWKFLMEKISDISSAIRGGKPPVA